MKDFAGFIGNVLAHWVALMSGVLSLAIAIYEQTRHGKRVTAKLFWLIAAIAILYGCFQARQDEHRNSERLTEEKAHITGELTACSFEGMLRDKDIASLREQVIKNEEFANQNRTIIDSQQQNLGRQSVQIGQCLIDEGKLNPAISTAYKVFAIPLWDDLGSNQPSPKGYLNLMLIQVNHLSVPYGLIDCAQNFEFVTLPRISPLSTDSMMQIVTDIPERVTSHSYRLNVKGSVRWEDANPIHFVVHSLTPGLGSCSFTPSH